MIIAPFSVFEVWVSVVKRHLLNWRGGTRMNLNKRLPLAITFTLSAICAILLISYGDVSAIDQNKTQSSAAHLTKEVRHELLTLPYYGVFDWLEFETRDIDTVILRGYVTRPTTKSNAEARVKDIEGVERVDNQIEVLPLSPNDDRLRIAVYRAIYNYDGPLFRYGIGSRQAIHIIVNNGNVTLKGFVDSKADKDMANIKANGVAGVFKVTNDLIIQKSE